MDSIFDFLDSFGRLVGGFIILLATLLVGK